MSVARFDDSSRQAVLSWITRRMLMSFVKYHCNSVYASACLHNYNCKLQERRYGKGEIEQRNYYACHNGSTET